MEVSCLFSTPPIPASPMQRADDDDAADADDADGGDDADATS